LKQWVMAALLAAASGNGSVGGGYAGPTTDPALTSLRARVATTAQAGRAHVGLAAIDLATGQMVSVNGGERFPMASTVKVAIAAVFLAQVQKGRESLDAYYFLPRAGRSGRAAAAGARSGAELLDLMLTRSDNHAADVLLHAVGGTTAVEAWLGHAGVAGQRVDRSIAQLLSDRQEVRRVRVGHGRHRRWMDVRVPRQASPGDNRDSSTPEAMAALLVKLRDGKLLDGVRTSYLFEVMSRCRTGPNRIRGQLPPGTPVAHKTGTLDGVTDDVGIVNLPNGHQLAIAVFERGPGGVGAHDRSIATLSRLLYDGFSSADQRQAGAEGFRPWGLSR
jgi:beta-lactamase class A